MRLAVYTDYTYRRVDDQIYAERAFALFLGQLANELEGVVLVGKLDPGPGPARYPLSGGMAFVPLPHYATLMQPREAISAMARSLGIFWRMLADVDAVWLLGPHPLALAFAALARVRGKGVALGVRQDFPRYVRARHPARRWTHVMADALEATWRTLTRFVPVIAVGPALAANYQRGRILELSVSLVRDADIAPEEIAAARAYEQGEMRVLSVGRLEEEKNPLLLADVIAALHRRDPAWRLVVCGEGPLEDQLRDRLSALGVSAYAELLGYVPHDRGLREIYRDSHALLHISWTEGLPQVLFEAFAARLPVVATAVGGVRAAAGDAAILIEPGDAEAAAEALARLSTDASLRERLIEAGIKRLSGRTLDAEARRAAAFLRSQLSAPPSIERRAQWPAGQRSDRETTPDD